MTTYSQRGFTPSLIFNANGLLSFYANAAAAGTFDSGASFDGTRDIWANMFIRYIRMRQLVDGGSGTTTVEIFRRRAGANTSLGTVSIASGGGAFATATLTPATTALRTLNGAVTGTAGDILVVQFNARQADPAAGITVEVGFQ